MLGFRCAKSRVGQECGCRLICVTLVLISISCLRNQKSFSQVEAIISPKARICFNSMSSTFQSECVYCDSRLYTHTISACTGLPTLANNVTQAQAFCIATACLEVPVLNKAEPFRVAANDLFANYMNKLNLFKPSLLFKAKNDEGAKWGRTYGASLGSKYQKMTFGGSLFGLNSDTSNQLMATMQQSSKNKLLLPNNFRQEVIDKVTDYVPGGAGDATTKQPESKVEATVSVDGSGVTTAAATATTAVAGTQVPASNDETKQSTLDIEYPDFNKMHSKIYGNWLNTNRNKFAWKRPPYPYLMMGNNPHQQQRQILTHMSNLMHTFSSRLAEKRANWQTGKIPVVLGRKKRSLLPSISFNLSKNKQKLQNNGTVTASLNKLVNGTTSGNLAFVLNKPSAAYIWSNPLTKVFTKNVPNKSLQWQFGKGQTVATASPVAAAGQMANPAAIRPAAVMTAATSGTSSGPTNSNARPQSATNLALNSQNSNAVSATRPSLAPVSSSIQAQQYNPTSASLVPAQVDVATDGGTISSANGASFVVPADEAAVSAARG